MKTRKTSALFLATTLSVVMLGNGCMWAPELTEVKRDIAGQLPDVTFRKNVTLSLGPLTMVLARAVVGFIPDAREARPYLRDVSKVQVAVYETSGDVRASAVETPARLQEMLDDGWEMAVRVREDDEMVWLLYRIDGDSVREMFVVVMGDEELVLVRVKGHLERIMAEALQNIDDEGSFLRGSHGVEI
jgi:hypothetical protein